jgi:hypothetical protein
MRSGSVCKAHAQYMYSISGEHYFGQRGESGGRGGNGGRAGCGGVSGYGGQSVIIAYQNRMNEKKASSSRENLAQPGQKGKAGRGGRKGKTAMIKKGEIYILPAVLVIQRDIYGQKPNEYFTKEEVSFAYSGIEPTECSSLSQKPSVPSEPIALY